MHKMNKYPIILLLLLLIFVSSCDQNQGNEDQAVIEIKYFPSASVLYLDEVHASSIKRLDSAELSTGGEITFTVNSPEYSLFKLVHDDVYPVIVVAKDGDRVYVEQTDDQAWPFIVKGNEECMLLAAYFEKLNRDEHRVDSLSYIFHNSQSHPDFLIIRESLNQAFIEIHQDHKAWAIEFISKNPGSFAALVMINSFFKEFLLFDQKEDFRYYKMVADAVMESMPENQYAIDLDQHVRKIKRQNKKDDEAMKRLAPGKAIPDFKVYTEDKTAINPTNFKGKNVMIYFWSAQNAPSRQANPYVKQAFEQYRNKGLELITISFDRSKDVWQAALKLDELPGMHCIETEGMGSPVQSLFNIKMHLPLYYLVDREGKIFSSSRDFRKLGEELQELSTLPSNN